MRILRAIVPSQSLFVAGGQSEFCFCGCVEAKPICHKNLGREALLLEQLSQESHCSSLVASSLDEQVQNLALVVNGSP
jgi:hypothetical protein